MFSVFSESTDCRIGKLFPAFTLMRTCLMGTDRQSGIKHQNALLRPTGQVTGFGYRTPQVALNLFKYILQRRRKKPLRRLQKSTSHAPVPVRDTDLVPIITTFTLEKGNID